MLKKRFFGMITLFTGVILAFCIIGCNTDSGTKGGSDGPFTVKFIANGGVTAPSDQTVEKGETVTEPPLMTNTNHEDFKGWYTNSNFTGNLYNFSNTVNTDLTLYAKWGYKVGDIGPAGGKIFYVDNGVTYSAVAQKYYEVSPSEPTGFGKCRWMGDSTGDEEAIGAVDYKITGAMGTVIGTGRANTNAILAVLSLPQFIGQISVPAASAADNYTIGGYEDWFLPSIGELNALHQSKVLSLFTEEHFYWSSTQIDETNPFRVWAQDFGDPETFQNQENKGHNYRTYVRPIRSFFCSH